MRVLVLGAIEALTAAHQPVSLGRAPSRRALARLVLGASHAVPSAALIEAAWPDQSPAAPEASLRMMVTRLRRSLAEPEADSAIEHTSSGYRLSAHIETDLAEFEKLANLANDNELMLSVGSLERAVSLWRAPPFEDFPTDAFVVESQRLTMLYRRTLVRLQSALITRGAAQSGLGRIETERRADPLDEQLAALAMYSYYSVGDQVRALGVFEELRIDLRDQLGVDPSRAVQETRLAILQRDASRLKQHAGQLLSADESELSIVRIVSPSLPGHVSGAPSFRRSPGSQLVVQARTSAALGHWRDATAAYLQAIGNETDLHNHEGVAALALELATITWDPELDLIVRRTITDTFDFIADQRLLAELRLCLAGGLHRVGSQEDTSYTPQHLRHDLQIVRASGTNEQIAWATMRARDALTGLVPAIEGLALSESVQALAIDDPQIRRQNSRAVFSDLLRLDRRSAASRVARSSRRNLYPTARAVDAFGDLNVQNCWNLTIGRFDEVQRGIAEMLTFRGRLAESTLDQVVLGQSFWLCRELGDLESVESHMHGARSLAEQNNETPIWSLAAGLLSCDLNRFEDAYAHLIRAHQQHDLTAVAVGSHRIGILSLAAEILGSVALAGLSVDRGLSLKVARQLRDEDQPGVLLGWPTVFAGPTSRFEGLAAIASGDHPTAVRLLDAATHADRHSRPHRIRSRRALAQVAELRAP